MSFLSDKTLNLLNKEVIKKRVDEGIYTLYSRENMKSVVWKNFKGILDEQNEEVFGMCCCVKCHVCIRYKSIRNGKTYDFGTKNLRDHLLYCGTPRSRKDWKKREVPTGNLSLNASLQNEQEMEKIEEDERSDSPIRVMPVVCKIETIADDDLLEAIGNQVDHLSHMRNHNSFSATTLHSAASRYLEEAGGPYSEHNKRTKASSSNGDREGEPSSEMFSQSSSRPFSEATNRNYEDEHDLFGRHIANELRSLPDDVARRWARFNIQKTLFEAHSFQRKET